MDMDGWMDESRVAVMKGKSRLGSASILVANVIILWLLATAQWQDSCGSVVLISFCDVSRVNCHILILSPIYLSMYSHGVVNVFVVCFGGRQIDQNTQLTVSDIIALVQILTGDGVCPQ